MMTDTSDNGPRKMSGKPDWAKRATELFPATDLAQEVKRARTSDLGGAVARQAEAFLTRHRTEQEQKGKRPWWQTEDCPDWCVRQHKDFDAPEHRFHEGFSSAEELSLEATLCNYDGERARTDFRKSGSPAYAWAAVRRNMGAREAHVVLQIGSGKYWSIRNLTAAEAYDLGNALLHMAIQARKITLG